MLCITRSPDKVKLHKSNTATKFCNDKLRDNNQWLN